MKSMHRIVLMLLLGTFFGTKGKAQNTAFTYQGNLTVLSNAVNGNFDLSFGLFGNPNATGVAISATTNLNVAVNNGLFTTMLDFGPNAFTGADLWLQIGVRSNGSTGNFIYL